MNDLKYLAVFWFVIFVFYSAAYLLKINSTFTDYAFFMPRIIVGLLSEVGIPNLLHSSTPHDQDCGLGFCRPSIPGYIAIFLLVSSLFLLCKIICRTIIDYFH